MLYTCLEHEIHIEQSLSLYLMHAAIYNNSDAIQILLEEYHVSPINTWPVINMITDKIETTIMPIVQITNFEKMEIDKKASSISRETQEYNFMLMLNNIIFLNHQ